MCFAVCFYVFYVYMGQVPEKKLMIMMMMMIIFVAVIILLRFAHVIFIEINVDKIINAFTKIFCKRCKRLSRL